MPMRQFLVRWTVPGGASEILNIFRASDLGDLAAQREALAETIELCAQYCGSGVTWTVDTSGSVQDTQTGQLVDGWTDPTVYTGGGSPLGGQVVAGATAMLLRWQTDTFISGRLVRGRTFIPGMSTTYLVDGGLSQTVQDGLVLAAQPMLDEALLFGIWSRGDSEGNGSLSQLVSASAWSELATQRRRRG